MAKGKESVRTFKMFGAIAQRALRHETAKKNMAIEFIVSTGRAQEFKDFCDASEKARELSRNASQQVRS